ncbi:MAG: hypothetical protein JW745_03590 [Sedimentisphaerales bacterium]|nr:hypothetical protein [Sedimentisphaerales bacterium]MBN2842849.1 hypothetical protein [Sedimentisphaerales bacterium]
MNLKRNITTCLLSLLLLSFTVGCNPAREKIRKFNDFYTTGQYDKALTFACNNISKNYKGNGEDLLWCLNAGAVYRIKQQPVESNQYFDHAEEIFNRHQAARNKAGETAAATIASDNVVAYTGKVYDGIMLNVYKALNFMKLQELELARVELNRALDRQRMAIEYYNNEVAKGQQAAQKKNINSDKVGDVSNGSYNSIISQKYPDLAGYKVYSDFVNPMANYLAGLFFYLDGDYNKSSQLLKEAVGMSSENQFVVADYEMVEKILNGQQVQTGHVWVIYENGLSPEREELLFGLPIPVNNTLIFIEIALPRLVNRSGDGGAVVISAPDMQLETKQLASMERVIQTEFKKEFDMILTRAIMSATAKAVAQYAVKDQDGLVQLGVLAYTLLSTAADVRMWTSLPREFQLARLPLPADGKLNISIAGSSRQIELPACDNAIIYIKKTNSNTPAIFDIIPFGVKELQAQPITK